MNEDLVITTRIAEKICNIINEKREKVFAEVGGNTDEFGFAVGKTYIKIGVKHKKNEKLFSASGFIDIHTKTFYPSASWTQPNKRYPKEITPSNLEVIAMRIYPYAFYPFVGKFK